MIYMITVQLVFLAKSQELYPTVEKISAVQFEVLFYIIHPMNLSC